MMFAGYIANLLATTISMFFHGGYGQPEYSNLYSIFSCFALCHLQEDLVEKREFSYSLQISFNNFQEIMKVNHIFQIEASLRISLICSFYGICDC